MKARLYVPGMALLVGFVLLTGAVACGDDGESTDTAAGATAPAGEQGRDRDRDQIRRVVTDYLAALHDQDRDRLRGHVDKDVPDQDLDRVRDRMREHQYELVEIADIRIDGDRATATLRLRDHEGHEVTRTLELERDQDHWRVRDPELHE